MHGSLYTDPAVWAAELERIWYRTWVFVGHASEVPEPNDYVLKSIGPQPVIMSRDREGQVRLLLNRCTHRANQVCDLPSGNTTTFRCPYHGWTFSNTGALLGYPFSSGYGGRDRKAELGLAEVPCTSVHSSSHSAVYWVPANGDDTDPTRQVSVLFDNRWRIATRIRQLESGKRHAQSPPSRLARLVDNDRPIPTLAFLI